MIAPSSQATAALQAHLADPGAPETAPNRDALIQRFIQQSGFAEHRLSPVSGDASRRRYVRVHTPTTSYIVMDAPPEHEKVDGYIAVCKFLYAMGYSSPRIIAEDAANGLLLLEDLGDDLFSRALEQNQSGDFEEKLYSEAIDLIATWHTRSDMHMGNAAMTLPAYSHAELMREVEIFADWYLPEVAAERYQPLAEEVMDIWRRILLRAPLANCYFVHRDFHASNLMWLGNRKGAAQIGLLDFQDAVWGDPAYDLVSLLEDARRDVSPELAEKMIQRYVDITNQPVNLLRERYAILGAQRNMKIIGIFHRLNQRDDKPAYLDFLPRVWQHLEHDLEHPSLAELRRWVDRSLPADWRR